MDLFEYLLMFWQHKHPVVKQVLNSKGYERIIWDFFFALDTCWTKVDDKAYWISTTKKKNKDAEADCISRGGKLAEPKNYRENSFVADLAERKGLSGFMIGIHDKKENGKEHEGHFVYESDNLPIVWKNWLPGQPNNKYNKCFGDEDCVEVKTDPKGKWNDICCGKRRYYVCEK